GILQTLTAVLPQLGAAEGARCQPARAPQRRSEIADDGAAPHPRVCRRHASKARRHTAHAAQSRPAAAPRRGRAAMVLRDLPESRVSLRERVSGLGGALSVTSSANGVELAMRIPLP